MILNESKERPKFREIKKDINNLSKEQLKNFLIKNKHNYLDEHLLIFYIKYFSYGYDMIANKKLEETNFRPDFIFPTLKLIVEFDGPHHYTNNITILKDIKRDEKTKSLGYKTIRIPYYIQFKKSEMITLFKDIPEIKNNILKEKDKVFSEFNNGFWSKNVVLPSSFCSRGMIRYKKEIENFLENVDDFFNSLYDSYIFKILEHRSVRAVFSPEQYEENMVLEKLMDSIFISDEYNDIKDDFKIFLLETNNL